MLNIFYHHKGEIYKHSSFKIYKALN